MSRVATIVKHWLIPGSTPLLFVGVVAGAVLLVAGHPIDRVGRATILALALVYWILSLPAVASALIAGLGTRFGRIDSAAAGHGARVLVAVGNGSVHYTDGRHTVDYLTRRSVYSAFEAARVFELLRPELVITTGGPAGPPPARPEADLMRELLVTSGVPPGIIVSEGTSATTEQQVANVASLITARGLTGTVAVVTTTAHMTRVVRLFGTRGISVVPSVTPELQYDEGRTGVGRWLPSMAALVGSSSAMYEYLANAPRWFRSPHVSTGR